MRSSARLEALTAINIDDFLISFGLDGIRRGKKAFEAAGWLPARRFAAQVLKFDDQVGEEGLHAAARREIKSFAGRLEVRGQANIPREGPVLILSNHPGMADTLALFAAIPREDLHIVAGDRPFLRCLTNISSRLIYVPEDGHGRTNVVRAVTGRLKAGEAVLTFPAGEIEPDPACMSGASESLEDWSESIAIFARLAPQALIVPTLVSGVILPASLTHPLARLRPPGSPRERMSASIQILYQTYLPWTRRGTIRVQFGAPIPAQSLADCGSAAEMTRAVTEQVARLIDKLEREK